MADTSLVEVARQTHEEIDRYETALVEQLLTSAPTHKDVLKRAHRTSHLLDRIVERTSSLNAFYADVKGERAAELARIAGSSSAAGGDALGEFYERLGRIRAYHEKYPGAAPDSFALDFSALEGAGASEGEASTGGAALDFVDRMFSGEEVGGRFLDLYVQHEAFLNLKGVKRCSYLQYLAQYADLAGENGKVPLEAKKSEAYRRYLADLSTYLLSFLRKTRPTSDVDFLELSALASFEQDWDAGSVLGWEDRGEAFCGGKGKAKETAGSIPGEGIWCDACKRSYAKQTVYDAHLKAPKHIKAAERLASGQASAAAPEASASNGATAGASHEVEQAKRLARAKAVARSEALVRKLAAELGDITAETRINVERKAALTDKERQAEAEAAAGAGGDGGMEARPEGEGDDDDDDDEKIYNPLKLPLGWDGKPIPYWLYKLHGLGVEYRCEICSDFVYQGRKNFERHFSESRHAFGMRALGLPNTKHFYEITRIEDALALAEKLKRQGKQVAEEEGDAEEVEDEHGNTYTRKTYELLKRQGII